MLTDISENTEIRRDLFAVKVWGEGGWCYEHIARSLETAQRYKNNNVALRRDFPLVKPRIVHPAQWVVEYFVAVGNTIVD